MYQLFKLIHTYRAFLTFLFIEFICLWALVRTSAYHSASFFHTSNILAARVLDIRHGIVQYFNLPMVNAQLAEDNARLRETIGKQQLPIIVATSTDSIQMTKPILSYGYLSAKIINNTTNLVHNYFTINKGRTSGVEPGMGVMTTNGIAGKVKAVSANFATVSSLLHTNVFVSATIHRNNTFCSLNWDGSDIRTSKLLYVPRHIPVQVGDTILTSGYNAVYPEKLMIGVVEKFELEDSSPFYDIDVRLANDFSQLSYVFVVKNPMRAEQVEIEGQNTTKDE